jgi:hypothetical protein
MKELAGKFLVLAQKESAATSKRVAEVAGFARLFGGGEGA